MLGVGKAVPAQFFADMQLRIYSANAPPAKRSIGYFSSKIANNLRGFELLPFKKERHDFCRVFLFGCRPFGISMLCRSKPSLRNCLVLRTCEFTAHQRRRSEDRSDISIAQILTVPSTSEQVFVSLAPTYFISQGTLVLLSFLSHCIPLRRARSGRAGLRAVFPRLSHQEGRYLRPQMPPLFAGSDVLIGPYPSTPLKKCP